MFPRSKCDAESFLSMLEVFSPDGSCHTEFLTTYSNELQQFKSNIAVITGILEKISNEEVLAFLSKHNVELSDFKDENQIELLLSILKKITKNLDHLVSFLKKNFDTIASINYKEKLGSILDVLYTKLSQDEITKSPPEQVNFLSESIIKLFNINILSSSNFIEIKNLFKATTKYFASYNSPSKESLICKRELLNCIADRIINSGDEDKIKFDKKSFIAMLELFRRRNQVILQIVALYDAELLLLKGDSEIFLAIVDEYDGYDLIEFLKKNITMLSEVIPEVDKLNILRKCWRRAINIEPYLPALLEVSDCIITSISTLDNSSAILSEIISCYSSAQYSQEFSPSSTVLFFETLVTIFKNKTAAMSDFRLSLPFFKELIKYTNSHQSPFPLEVLTNTRTKLVECMAEKIINQSQLTSLIECFSSDVALSFLETCQSVFSRRNQIITCTENEFAEFIKDAKRYLTIEYLLNHYKEQFDLYQYNINVAVSVIKLCSPDKMVAFLKRYYTHLNKLTPMYEFLDRIISCSNAENVLEICEYLNDNTDDFNMSNDSRVRLILRLVYYTPLDWESEASDDNFHSSPIKTIITNQLIEAINNYSDLTKFIIRLRTDRRDCKPILNFYLDALLKSNKKITYDRQEFLSFIKYCSKKSLDIDYLLRFRTADISSALLSNDDNDIMLLRVKRTEAKKIPQLLASPAFRLVQFSSNELSNILCELFRKINEENLVEVISYLTKNNQIFSRIKTWDDLVPLVLELPDKAFNLSRNLSSDIAKDITLQTIKLFIPAIQTVLSFDQIILLLQAMNTPVSAGLSSIRTEEWKKTYTQEYTSAMRPLIDNWAKLVVVLNFFDLRDDKLKFIKEQEEFWSEQNNNWKCRIAFLGGGKYPSKNASHFTFLNSACTQVKRNILEYAGLGPEDWRNKKPK